MNTIIFALPGNEKTARCLAKSLRAEEGNAVLRSFPDGESYVCVESDVEGKTAVVVATLRGPDDKLLPLVFLAAAFKDLGAKRVVLVAPYLAYMRQDRRFRMGEAVTSIYFARLISDYFDGLVTVDPHLHRLASLNEIYSIPNIVLHAAPVVSKWIRETVESPLIVGPDSESEQWVRTVAEAAGAPYVVLEKIRRGDRDVEVSVPQLGTWQGRIPVLVDDIISTGKTMIETIKHLKAAGVNEPLCIGVHAVFAGKAYEELVAAGAAIYTCDTIPHASNSISVLSLLVEGIWKLQKTFEAVPGSIGSHVAGS